MPARRGILLDVQLFAFGDAELFPHQIQTGRDLGYRVFHLQPGIDFQEVNEPGGVHQVFHRAGTVIAGLLADPFRRFMQSGALLLGEEGSRGLLHELLEPALQRAVTGTGHDHIAVHVGQHLAFHVSGLVHVSFHETFTSAECG